MSKPALVLALAALVGCDGSSDPTAIDAPSAVDAPPGIDAMPDPTVVEMRTVRIGPLTIPPGEERTVCVVVDLGTEVPRMLRGLRTALTAGTHHVIITRTVAAPNPTPVPCAPFAGGGGHDVLFIAQQSAAALTYPTGSGLPIAAHQSIHIEMHYLNTDDEPMMIGGSAELDLAAESTGLREIDFLFTGGASISIPAHGTQTVETFHTLPVGSELFAATAHTHQWGRRATLELTDASGAAPRLLHDSTNWAERPIDVFTPIVITEGQGLRLTCNFENQSDQPVSFGLSADDEMCFLWTHQIAPP